MDYNIILQRDKQNLLNRPKEIKQLFVDAFNEIATEYGFNYANDSTSVITVRLVKDQWLVFSFDVAVTVEDNKGAFHRLTFDKKTGHYFWNEVKHSKDYSEKFQWVRERD